ncbi:MAG: hypothetical protein HY976_02975 [Candidatus Kerfeldbacteria bacterium]|nr:hypothetical protein [Candidatus Kerfeldbacteria bacterium]
MFNQRGSQHLLIILALFFGAAVVVTIFGYMMWPKDSDTNTNTVVNLNRTLNGNTNVPANTNTTINTNRRVDTAVVSIKVVILDNQTTKPIANQDVTLYSDNGIRCVQEPCPTNGRTWNGTTNGRGEVVVPGDMVDSSMIFTVAGYQGADLRSRGAVQADGSWKLLLAPKTTSSVKTEETPDPTVGWQTYTNDSLNFSLRFPKTFERFQAASERVGWRGDLIAVAKSSESGDEATVSLYLKNSTYDPEKVEGLYGPIDAENLMAVVVGNQSGSMFRAGDAGCGGLEVLTALGTKTLWVSFQDCEDVGIETTGTTPLYDQPALVRQILSTFDFSI